MKFIVDHQLPPALAGFLQTSGHEAQHVRELGMKQAADALIWKHATANNLVVVSKDEDFYYLATTPGNKTKLVWVRIGNTRTLPLIEVFKAQLPRIIAAFESGSHIVEIR